MTKEVPKSKPRPFIFCGSYDEVIATIEVSRHPVENIRPSATQPGEFEVTIRPIKPLSLSEPELWFGPTGSLPIPDRNRNFATVAKFRNGEFDNQGTQEHDLYQRVLDRKRFLCEEEQAVLEPYSVIVTVHQVVVSRAHAGCQQPCSDTKLNSGDFNGRRNVPQPVTQEVQTGFEPGMHVRIIR